MSDQIPGFDPDQDLDDLFEPEPISVVDRVNRYADLVLEDEEPEVPLERREHHVIAVLVAHEGQRWLRPSIATIERLERPPDVMVAVDTGSADATGELLREWLGDDAVVTLGPDAPFGAALRAGLARADDLIAAGEADAPEDGDIRWLWMLHDDCAPDPGALQALLDSADVAGSAAVLGPKVLGWHDQRLLLEVGVTIAESGRRVTGLERGEQDQGQHDGLRPVLSVGSAGMLVRLDAWDALGGFDPRLPMFRDDLDFGWRANEAGYRVMVATDAVVHHAEAGAHGRRPLAAVDHDAGRADREAAMHVLLAHSAGWAIPLLLLRLVVGSLARGVGLLLAKAPDEAADEFGAVGSLLLHPGRVLESRRLVARTRQVRPRELASLRPRFGSQVRHGFEALVAVISGSSGTSVTTSGTAAAGPSDDEAFDDTFDESGGRLAFWLRRPALLLALVLAALSLVSVRSWFGSGLLAGGALLPAPPGAGDLWSTYAQGWHDVGPGSSAPAPPYLMVLGFVSALLLGSASRGVDAVLMMGIPVAAVIMYLSLRRVVTSRVVRTVAAAAYALLPAAVGAVASGRLGTVVFLILLPALIRVGLRVPVSWRAAWGGAFLLAVITAFVPVVWPLTVIAAVAALFLARGIPTLAAAGVPGAEESEAQRSVLDPSTGAAATALVPFDFRARNVRLRMAAFVVTPILLLVPWSLELLRHPAWWLLQAGLPGPTDPDLAPWSVALLHPGGPGDTPVWFTLGLLALGVGGLVRKRSRPLATVAWLLVVAGLILGVLQTLVQVRPPSETLPVHSWPGPATIVLGLGLIVAASAAADGIERRLSGRSFTWRQPAAILAIVGAVLAPVLAGAWWAWQGVGDTVARSDGSAVPAFVAAESVGPDRPRSLVFRPGPRGVDYALIDGEGPRLGAAETGPPSEAYDQLNALVADLMAGRGGAEINGLGRYGVRFVVLSGTSPELVAVLDSEPGLRRVSSAEGDTLWTLDTDSDRVRAVAEKPLTTPIAAGSRDGAVWVDGPLPAGMAPASTLVLAERADPSWRATLDGQVLAVEPASDVAADAWRQAFAVPAATGVLRVWFDQEPRHRWIWAQGLLVGLVIVLALPGRRRPEEDPDADEVGADIDADADADADAAVGDEIAEVTA